MISYQSTYLPNLEDMYYFTPYCILAIYLWIKYNLIFKFSFNILGEIQHGIAEEGPAKETYLA